jgi:hypothetical protein
MSSTRTRSTNAWRIGGSAIAALMLAFGSANAVSALAHDTWHVRRVVEAPVRVVDVSTSTGGSIAVVGDPTGDDVIVDMTVSRGLETPSHSEVVEGDRLVVRSGCLWILTEFCQVDYVISVPDGVSVVAHADGRDVVVSGIRGDLDLSSDGGAVVVRGVEAERVRLDSDGGDVTADGLAATSIEASSDGGDVRLSLASPPTTVVASSDGGDVEIVLPDTSDAYRVDLSSDGGGTDAAIRTDPASERSITASSNGGDVVVRYPAT